MIDIGVTSKILSSSFKLIGSIKNSPIELVSLSSN